MICVGKNEEDVLYDRNEELLEESIRCSGVGLRNVCDQLQTHVESSIFNFAVIVLACPHARVNYKLELSVVELEESCRSY